MWDDACTVALEVRLYPPITRFARRILSVAGVVIGVVAQSAMAEPSPQQTAKERADAVDYVLTRQPLEQVAQDRRLCASGRAPAAIARSRSLGAEAQPDASALCATALARIGREGQLQQFYRGLLSELNVTTVDPEAFIARIAASALASGSGLVPLGNQRAAVVTASLAFDAGFSTAYGKKQRVTQGMPQTSALVPVAERCLAHAEPNLGLCYSTGYVYGALAFSEQPLTHR